MTTAIQIETQSEAQAILDNKESTFTECFGVLEIAKRKGWEFHIGVFSLEVARVGSAEDIKKFFQLGCQFNDYADKDGFDAVYYIAQKPDGGRLAAYVQGGGPFTNKFYPNVNMDTGLLLAVHVEDKETLKSLSGRTDIFSDRRLVTDQEKKGMDAGCLIARKSYPSRTDIIAAFHAAGGRFTEATDVMNRDAGHSVVSNPHFPNLLVELIEAFTRADGVFSNKVSLTDVRPFKPWADTGLALVLQQSGYLKVEVIKAFTKGGGKFTSFIGEKGLSAGLVVAQIGKADCIQAYVETGAKFVQAFEVVNTVLDSIEKGKMPVNILDLVVQNTPFMPQPYSSEGQQLSARAGKLNIDLYKIPRGGFTTIAVSEQQAANFSATLATPFAIQSLFGGKGSNTR